MLQDWSQSLQSGMLLCNWSLLGWARAAAVFHQIALDASDLFVGSSALHDVETESVKTHLILNFFISNCCGDC